MSYQLEFPVAFHTVDCAITKKVNEEIYILLGQKRKETESGKFRFPGGFIDPYKEYYSKDGIKLKSIGDATAEDAALREAKEECGNNLELDYPKYICSHFIDDERYKNSDHSILTTFFQIGYLWGQVKASDDLAKVEWFKLNEDLFQIINPIHQTLLQQLLFKIKMIK